MRENPYDSVVFLSHLLEDPEYGSKREWLEHQQMQYDFLVSRGFDSATRFLDLGCGPLRLGVRLIPELTSGWYFGQDINGETLEAGRRVLADAGVTSERFRLIRSDNFDLSAVDRPIDLAFSNSLFSHLTINSILIALTRVRAVLAPGAVYYSTFFDLPPGHDWTRPCPRNKWGHGFNTFPYRDPYHYPAALLQRLAETTGFSMTLDEDFGHPTQTMARFEPL